MAERTINLRDRQDRTFDFRPPDYAREVTEGIGGGMVEGLKGLAGIPALAWQVYRRLPMMFPFEGSIIARDAEAAIKFIQETWPQLEPRDKQGIIDSVGQAGGEILGAVVGGIGGGVSGGPPGALAGAALGAGAGGAIGLNVARGAGEMLGGDGFGAKSGPQIAGDSARAFTSGMMPEALTGGMAGMAAAAKSKPLLRAMRPLTKPSAEQRAFNLEGERWGLRDAGLGTLSDRRFVEAMEVAGGSMPWAAEAAKVKRAEDALGITEAFNRFSDSAIPAPRTSPGEAMDILRQGHARETGAMRDGLRAISDEVPRVSPSDAGVSIKAGRREALDSLKQFGEETYRPIMEQYGKELVDVTPVRAAIQDILKSDTQRQDLGKYLSPEARKALGLFEQDAPTASTGRTKPGRVEDPTVRVTVHDPAGTSVATNRRIGPDGRRMTPENEEWHYATPGTSRSHTYDPGARDALGRPIERGRLDAAGQRLMPGDVASADPSGVVGRRTSVDHTGMRPGPQDPITLEQWKNIRSELLSVASDMSRKTGISSAVVGQINSALNNALEATLDSGLAGKIGPDGVTAIRNANEAFRREASRLRDVRGPDGPGNQMAGRLDQGEHLVNDRTLLSLSRGTPDEVRAVQAGLTPVGGSAGDPVNHFNAAAARQRFPFDDLQPSLMERAKTKNPGLPEALGVDDQVARYSSPEMLQTESKLGRWDRINDTQSSDTALLRSSTGNKRSFDDALWLAGDQGDRVRKARLQDELGQVMTTGRENLLDQDTINTKRLGKNMAARDSEVVQGIFGGDQANMESFDNLLGLGDNASYYTRHHMNSSGSGEMNRNAASIGAVLATLSGNIHPAKLTGFVAAPFMAKKMLTDPDTAKFLTADSVPPWVRPDPTAVRTAASRLRGPMMLQTGEREGSVEGAGAVGAPAGGGMTFKEWEEWEKSQGR
jgi:hypothetical protein